MIIFSKAFEFWFKNVKVFIFIAQSKGKWSLVINLYNTFEKLNIIVEPGFFSVFFKEKKAFVKRNSIFKQQTYFSHITLKEKEKRSKRFYVQHKERKHFI